MQTDAMQNATLISKATIAIEIRTRKFNAQYGSKRARTCVQFNGTGSFVLEPDYIC